MEQPHAYVLQVGSIFHCPLHHGYVPIIQTWTDNITGCNVTNIYNTNMKKYLIVQCTESLLKNTC